ncbi:MAG: hypothetical protein ACHQF2_10700 [Flavobacteriales bacterium]
MKKITYPVLLALWMVVAVSCQKEAVKPCNPANGGDFTLPDYRDGELGGSTTDPTNPTPSGTDTTGNNGTEVQDEEGITDGGGSSEQDSKGKKKKP